MNTNPDDKMKLESIEEQRKRVEEENHIWMINEEIRKLGRHYRIRLRETKQNSSNLSPGEESVPRWEIYYDPGP